MMRILRNVVVVTILSIIAFSCADNYKHNRPNPLLLISFDGFRHDYLSKAETPNFDAFAAEGVKAKGLISVFPTKTFPNHYAIATGLYSENNGLVGNTMYDPELEEWYRISDRKAVENARWYSGEPIWNTAEKQGLRAGTMFWVGSETDIQQMRPTYWKKFNARMPYKARIDTVVKWLSYPDEQRVDFATLYFSMLDHAAHRYGPGSDSVDTALRQADSLLGYLHTQMQNRQLWDKTNIIIVSDHGMAAMGKDKIILLDSIIDTARVERMTLGAISMIQPKAGQTETVYKQLKCCEDHYRVYKKEDLPERYHLKNNRRIPALIVIPDLGYMIIKQNDKQRFIDRLPGGMHGYDNNEKAMQGIFMAHGPAFKQGLEISSFQNIHIYELMTRLLNIQPAPNDGSLDSLKVTLKDPDL